MRSGRTIRGRSINNGEIWFYVCHVCQQPISGKNVITQHGRACKSCYENHNGDIH